MATFYDILTHGGEYFYSNHASLLLLATADQNYFTDEGGSLSGRSSILASVPGGESITVGGICGADGNTRKSFEQTGIDSGEAILFRGNGTISFSASTGARSTYADRLGADRDIAISVTGRNSIYGVRAQSSLTVRGDAAANISMKNTASVINTISAYFSGMDSCDTAGYRAVNSLSIRKNLTGTISCENTSLTMKLAAGSYSLTSTQMSFITGTYVYEDSIAQTGIRASSITVSGEMNSFTSISTNIKDVDITLYLITATDTNGSTKNYIPSLSAAVASIGILADGDITFTGGVSGGSISASLKNIVFRMGKGSITTTSRLQIYDDSDIHYFDGDCQAAGIRGGNLIVKNGFSPDAVNISAENVKQNISAVGV